MIKVTSLYFTNRKKVILTKVDGVLPLVCAVYLKYTLLKFYFTFYSFILVQYF